MGRNLILVILLIFLLNLFGCSFSVGGNSPQKKPEESKEDVQKTVREEMKSPEVKNIIESAAKTQRLEQLLDSPEAATLVQQEIIKTMSTPDFSMQLVKSIGKSLSTPDVQKQLQEQVKKSLSTSEVEKELRSAVQKSVMSIIQGGQGGQSGQGGGQGGGSQGGGS